ncbi:cysteine hydrolase family protein [Chitinophaga sancti]|uniref:Isochorismatase family cysteine hydrolase n=1 Tax=Chitinophaga sancti TaxID=1004 RepID=A0A1K1SQC9_9BACT|nr:isochorismatase family cysteine hydrolase [Chitinophaga sancti]WQD64384.1 isochorismatase family cysteine hydrolase [Chitinophaga sancti]WQG89992.1 isochorismatase family cysteine hydrolase [Chitinophaga sancti]SFW86077.1 Nicotinamidase-related amidase [Chitinophaga sancti]
MSNTALLVMDMQAAMLSSFGAGPAVTAKVATAIASARSKSIPVIYVVVGFRPGAPEISANNKGFSAAKQQFAGIAPADFMKIHPDLEPLENEPVVIKRRVSAFAGSDLEVLLRSLKIEEIVLTGIATSGVVLSTLREAADKDFRIKVLSDACADREQEVHDFLTTRIFNKQGEVLTVAEWTK